MSTVTTVAPSGCDVLDQAVISDTMLGVLDAHDLICDPNTTWLNDLADLLPSSDLSPSENRFMMLMQIALKSEQIHERAVDLLVEERAADTSLQGLMDALATDGAVEENEIDPIHVELQ
jgi:hypothetical protein